jgi:hypothetical protein
MNFLPHCSVPRVEITDGNDQLIVPGGGGGGGEGCVTVHTFDRRGVTAGTPWHDIGHLCTLCRKRDRRQQATLGYCGFWDDSTKFCPHLKEN